MKSNDVAAEIFFGFGKCAASISPSKGYEMPFEYNREEGSVRQYFSFSKNSNFEKLYNMERIRWFNDYSFVLKEIEYKIK